MTKKERQVIDSLIDLMEYDISWITVDGIKQKKSSMSLISVKKLIKSYLNSLRYFTKHFETK
jgi:hypothetical protein